jgi:hypothetical protein
MERHRPQPRVVALQLAHHRVTTADIGERRTVHIERQDPPCVPHRTVHIGRASPAARTYTGSSGPRWRATTPTGRHDGAAGNANRNSPERAAASGRAAGVKPSRNMADAARSNGPDTASFVSFATIMGAQ